MDWTSYFVGGFGGVPGVPESLAEGESPPALPPGTPSGSLRLCAPAGARPLTLLSLWSHTAAPRWSPKLCPLPPLLGATTGLSEDPACRAMAEIVPGDLAVLLSSPATRPRTAGHTAPGTRCLVPIVQVRGYPAGAGRSRARFVNRGGSRSRPELFSRPAEVYLEP